MENAAECRPVLEQNYSNQASLRAGPEQGIKSGRLAEEQVASLPAQVRPPAAA